MQLTIKLKDKFVILMVVMVTLAVSAFFANTAYAAESDFISFPDANLKQALLNQGADTSGDGEISEGEMAALTGTIDLSGKNIINLEGIQHAINIDGLYLNGTDVNSLDVIQGMTQLTKLNLYATDVRDISGLSNLTNLTYLNLGYDYLPTNCLSKLEPLVSLEYLNLTNSNFYDISPLHDMIHLKELDLSYNNVVSVDALSNMYELETLNLKYCKVTDISALEDKTSLTTIDVSNNYLNPNDVAGDMAVLGNIDNVTGTLDQYQIKITYSGGLYGTPDRSTDSVYHGDRVILPSLEFECSFDVEGWDTDGDGITDASVGSEYIAEPPLVSNHYRATYNAVYKRDYVWSSGSGTVEDPYLVSTPEQINEIRYFPDACFLMINDIDMSAITSEGGALYDGGMGFDPIYAFNGLLDGGGYSISGLFSNRVKTSFITTVTETAEIKNLTLNDIHMEGEDSASGICHENSGLITNCIVTGYIAQTASDISTYNGGIAGINYGTISFCKVSGTVTALDDNYLVGGIAAFNGGVIENSVNAAAISAIWTCGGIADENSGTIMQCYNTGYVSGSTCGGIAGDNRAGGRIADCYNTGYIRSASGAGISGANAGTITCCYNIGTVVGKTLVYRSYGGSVNNCFTIKLASEAIEPDSQVNNVYHKTNAELQLQSTYSGFDFDTVWTMGGDSAYPYPELRSVNYTAPAENTVEFAGGNGTPYSPFQVSTPLQLYNIRNYIYSWFVLKNDIDMTEATSSGGVLYNNGNGWTSIGDDRGYFSGVFEGNFHHIIGLSGKSGLFSNCKVSAIIRNLGVADANITGGGGIIASKNEGDIIGCYTSGEIYGGGGLVQENRGLISNCYSSAFVKGSYAGGLANNNYGTMENCYSVGGVSTGFDIVYAGNVSTSCYHWKNDRDATGKTSGQGTELTQDEFCIQASFEYLNFDHIWTMEGDSEYPYPELIGLQHIDRENTVEFAGGNGLPYDPYQISTVAQLYKMKDHPLSSFELVNDINLEGASWTPYGFYGNFDGNGHIISNGNINSTSWNTGFFGSTNYSMIRNLGLQGFNVIGTKYTGVFAGSAIYSHIENCWAVGNVDGDEYAGIFTGYTNSQFINCYTEGTISGEKYIGGFAGYLFNYRIDDTVEEIYEDHCILDGCYSISSISGTCYLGGIAGGVMCKTSLANSYAICDVDGGTSAGGFIGLTGGSGNVANCYALGTTTGSDLSTGAFIGNEGSEIIYTDCFWYSYNAQRAIGTGNSISVEEIDFPEIDTVDINTPVSGSGITTNMKPFGAPSSITLVSTGNATIAKVEDGQLKGVALGNTTATLHLTYSSGKIIQIDDYRISVTGTPNSHIPVTGVSLDKQNLYMEDGSSLIYLTATVAPSTATNKKIIWTSSDESVATVNDWGLIKPYSSGYTTITVTTEDGSYSAACNVSINVPTAVDITAGGVYLWPTETAMLPVKVYPSQAPNTNVIWSSSDTSIATVGSTTGIVYAVSPGTVTITATTVVGGLTDMATVIVKQHVTGVELTPESFTVSVGQQYKSLSVGVLPSTAFTKTVSYASSNNAVARVDSNGYITGVSSGTATITVTTSDGSFKDTCVVTVKQPVTNVYITSTAKIDIGDTYTLSATVLPANATYPEVTWSSSNEDIATIDQTGRIAAAGFGTATITATADGKSDTCMVTVVQPVTSVSLDVNAETLLVGSTKTLSATVSPSDATYSDVTWSSSNTAVATVDNFGRVTAVSAGNATITATADTKSATCNITVQPAQYTITALPSNATFGTVTGGGSYDKDASVTLTATPKAGYRFVRWSTGITQLSTSIQYTLRANADQSITAEFAPIGTPTLYAASEGYTSARLAWTAVEGAAGYEVWRSASAGGTYSRIGTVTGTSYTDNSLTTNTPYYYKVNAYCMASTATTYGSQSAYAAATPVPAAATVYASPTNYNSAYVSWNAVPGASGYELSRSTSQNSGYSVVKNTSSLSYTNSSLNTGTTYYYRVRAYRTVGRTKAWGDYSALTSATPVLSSVTSASASAYYPTSIKVLWSAVPGRTKYEVLRSDSATGTYTRIGSTTSTYYKDTTCTPFVTYYYQIKVYRTVNRQPIYSASTSPTASATPILGNVSGVKAAVSSPSSVKISWASVTGASGYEVLRSTTIDGGYISIKSTTGRSFTDTSCTPNTTYYYQVRAYRKVGGGTVSSAPSAAISATPYFGSISNAKAVRSSAGKIKLTWSAVSGRTGYEIYRRSSPDSDFVLIKNTTSTSFTDSGLTTGVTYEYKIVAYRTVNGVKYRSTESVVSATP